MIVLWLLVWVFSSAMVSVSPVVRVLMWQV